MKIGIMKWPGGPYIADRSQQGLHRDSCLVMGPLQINWAGGGWRIYVTWPVSFCIYAQPMEGS